MAYRLRAKESIAQGLERIVRRELRTAIDQLGGMDVSEEAVHEARKSIKKVRAIVQLVGDELHARRDVKHLRRAGRLLAPLRDADALIESARKLCAPSRGLPEATCSVLRERLHERQSRLSGGRRSRRLNEQAAAELKKVQRSAKRWDWKRIRGGVLADEIRRSYKKARRAMAQARGQQGADTFHSWRKRVKTLWYALRLLPRHRQPITRQIDAFEQLQTWLGEDHNLAALRAQLSRILKTRGSVRVMSIAEQRQEVLRRQALTSGAREFKDNPKAFTRRVERMIR